MTNGEWNTLRSKGNTRPLSIFELRSNARNKYNRKSIKVMLGMLTPKGYTIQCMYMYECTLCIIVKEDGTIQAEICNPSVPSGILKDIHMWMEEGCSMDHIIERLRNRTACA